MYLECCLLLVARYSHLGYMSHVSFQHPFFDLLEILYLISINIFLPRVPVVHLSGNVKIPLRAEFFLISLTCGTCAACARPYGLRALNTFIMTDDATVSPICDTLTFNNDIRSLLNDYSDMDAIEDEDENKKEQLRLEKRVREDSRRGL